MNYEDTDSDFADFTDDDARALADMEREQRTAARRAQLREALEGDRVKNKFQHHRTGVLIEILPGCNALARVQFDGDAFTVLLPLSDLIQGGAQ